MCGQVSRLLGALLVLLSLQCASGGRLVRVPRFRPPAHHIPRASEQHKATQRVGWAPGGDKPLIQSCQELWRDAQLDHFNWRVQEFRIACLHLAA